MAVCKTFLAVPLACAALILLAGCTTPVRPGTWAAPTKTWRGVQATWDDFSGWREWMPGYQNRKAIEARQGACVLVETESRVVTQDGVNDAVDYQRCYNTPYGVATGQRLDGR